MKANPGNIPKSNVLPGMGGTKNKRKLKFCTNNPFCFEVLGVIFFSLTFGDASAA
jgi:hypothetical protein